MNLPANQIKRSLSAHLMLRLSYFAVHEEYENHYGRCDVYGITKADYGVEFEIKVSKSDLMSEIRAIMAVLDNTMPDRSCNKYAKHRDYLHKETHDSYRLPPPCKFIFVVTSDLVEVARPIISQTPYGLWAVTDSLFRPFEVIKQAENLHKNKVSEKHIRHLLRSLSYRFALASAQ